MFAHLVAAPASYPSQFAFEKFCVVGGKPQRAVVQRFNEDIFAFSAEG